MENIHKKRLEVEVSQIELELNQLQLRESQLKEELGRLIQVMNLKRNELGMKKECLIHLRKE
jgi:hypothetical protein